MPSPLCGRLSLSVNWTHYFCLTREWSKSAGGTSKTRFQNDFTSDFIIASCPCLSHHQPPPCEGTGSLWRSVCGKEQGYRRPRTGASKCIILPQTSLSRPSPDQEFDWNIKRRWARCTQLHYAQIPHTQKLWDNKSLLLYARKWWGHYLHSSRQLL